MSQSECLAVHTPHIPSRHDCCSICQCVPRQADLTMRHNVGRLLKVQVCPRSGAAQHMGESVAVGVTQCRCALQGASVSQCRLVCVRAQVCHNVGVMHDAGSSQW